MQLTLEICSELCIFSAMLATFIPTWSSKESISLFKIVGWSWTFSDKINLPYKESFYNNIGNKYFIAKM